VADGGGVTGEPDEGVLAVSTAHQPPAPYPQKKKKNPPAPWHVATILVPMAAGEEPRG
jgi:hypothetical protein